MKAISLTDNAWPAIEKELPSAMKKCFTARNELSIANGLLLNKNRTATSVSLERKVLKKCMIAYSKQLYN